MNIEKQLTIENNLEAEVEFKAEIASEEIAKIQKILLAGNIELAKKLCEGLKIPFYLLFDKISYTPGWDDYSSLITFSLRGVDEVYRVIGKNATCINNYYKVSKFFEKDLEINIRKYKKEKGYI